MKHITLEVVKRNTKKVTFRIKEQTHRGKEFGGNYEYGGFLASSRILLRSRLCPEILESGEDAYSHILYTLGCNGSLDETNINTTPGLFQRIEKAVAEYNEYYNLERTEEGDVLLNVYEVRVRWGMVFGRRELRRSLLIASKSAEEACTVARKEGYQPLSSRQMPGLHSAVPGIIFEGHSHEI